MHKGLQNAGLVPVLALRLLVLTAVLVMAVTIPSKDALIAKSPGRFDSLDISVPGLSLLPPHLPAQGKEDMLESSGHKTCALVTWHLFEHPRVE